MKMLISVAGLSLVVLSCSTQKDPENREAQVNRSRPPAEATWAAGSTPSPATVGKDTDIAKDQRFAGTTGTVDKKRNVSGVAILADVRTGRHEGFDRMVFEFGGTELPSYHIEYIDRPVRACGSGDEVPLAGDAWLQVRFSPAAAHDNEGKATVGFRELSPRLPVILEIKSTCDFEAEVEWVSGVSSPNAFRVLELSDPTRLVIDIKHR